MMKYSLAICAAATVIFTAGAALATQMPGHAGRSYVGDAVSGSSHADVEKHNACPYAVTVEYLTG